MSTRLTKTMREAIERKLIRDKFEKPFIENRKAFHVLADKIYRDVYGNDVSKMNRLPDGWLPTSGSILVRIAGQMERPELDKPRRLPYEHSRHQVVKQYSAGEEIAREFRALKDAKNDLEQARDNTSAEIRAVLNSVNTLAQLVEAWPEIADLARKICDRPVENLPAIRIDSLNSKLGLSA